MLKPTTYDGIALIADPIHSYITFTVPSTGSDEISMNKGITKGHENQRDKNVPPILNLGMDSQVPQNLHMDRRGFPTPPEGFPSEKTEKDLIDSPWMQRLRHIYQLQSARWVFPSAEHSRFQHSLGAMHIAGRFAGHLYPTLKAVIKDCPSEAYIEELLRTTALLHDVGHGPFGHFFDDNILNEYDETHETVGQKIIIRELGDIIKGIRRSPNGAFNPGEELMPEYLAFLIGKGPYAGSHTQDIPRWLLFLQPLLSGIYTVDNMDYVLRDSFMCGVAIGPVDIDRLIHYTFFTDKGISLHRSGLSALNMFLNARLYMYTNVYYHRTTRAIDLHLKEIFKETIKLLFPYNPVERLDKYLLLTDWSLLEGVRGWAGSNESAKSELYPEWQKILGRDVKWKMAYDKTLSIREVEKGRRFIYQEELHKEIQDTLPEDMKYVPFRVDMASQDPRPINPLMMGERQIYVYNPSTGEVSKEALREFFDYIPAKVVLCRIFALNHQNDRLLASAAEKVLVEDASSIKTNV